MSFDAATEQLPEVVPGLAVAEFDDGVVVFDPQREIVIRLEPMAAVAFDACREGVLTHDLVVDFVEGLGLSGLDAQQRVAEMVDLLRSAQLVEGDDPAIEDDGGPPCVGCSDSDDGAHRHRRRAAWRVPRARRKRA